MEFQKPDAKTIAKMTPQSLRALIEALEKRRAEAIKPLDEQLNYYRNLLKEKVNDAKTTS